MKASTALALVAGAVTVATHGADARAMYARLDYHRYLQEIDDTKLELEAWKMKFGETAKKNGWMPVSEDRSADEDDEDLLQRFFLAKQRAEAASAANPKANFSTDTPFSLMLEEEWTAARVSGGLIGVNSSSTTERRLRGWRDYYETESNAGSSQSVAAESEAATSSYISTTTDGYDETLASSSENSDGSDGDSYNFNKFYDDWGDNWGRVQPAGPSDSDAASSSSPDASTPAAATRTPAQSSTTAPAATTSAPAKKTSAPATTTSAPAVTNEVATTDSATPNAAEGSVAASETDSSTVDWSKTACMGPVQYQGQCGNCWAFATVAAVESAHCIINGQKSFTKYSDQQVTSCESRSSGCNGGVPVYAIDYITQNGLCTETDNPYTSGDGDSGSCSSTCTKEKTGITGYAEIRTADELASVVAKQPVVVSVASSNSAWQQYVSGVVSSCDSTELDHAVVAVGYTDTEWKIRNSWGEEWGEQGYIRLERTSDSDGVCGMYQEMSYPTMS